MGFSIFGQMIVTFLPDGQCGLLLSSAVEVFMQKVFQFLLLEPLHQGEIAVILSLPN